MSLVKFFDVYGDGRPCETDVVTKFAGRLSKGLSPIIHGEGLQTRGFISVDDVIDGILLSIKAMQDIEHNNLSSPLVFNIGSGIPKSINQLAQKMIGLFGLALRPIYEERIEDRRAIMNSYANITKSKELLHFVAKKRIETGLREIIKPMLLRE